MKPPVARQSPMSLAVAGVKIRSRDGQHGLAIPVRTRSTLIVGACLGVTMRWWQSAATPALAWGTHSLIFTITLRVSAARQQTLQPQIRTVRPQGARTTCTPLRRVDVAAAQRSRHVLSNFEHWQ